MFASPITFVLKSFHIHPFGHLTLADSFMEEVGEVMLEPQMTELDTAKSNATLFGIGIVSISQFLPFLHPEIPLGRLLIDRYL